MLPNNAIISATLFHYISGFTCYSGSIDGDVGQLIGLDGQDITHSKIDHFTVVVGDANNPGTVKVTRSRISSENEGVYTCRIPDQSGEIIDVNVGLFQHNFSG